MSRSCAFAGMGGLSMPEGTQRDAETAGDDPHRFQNPEDAGCGDRADGPRSGRSRGRSASRSYGRMESGGIDGHVGQVAADHPDQRHQHEIREDAAGAEIMELRRPSRIRARG